MLDCLRKPNRVFGIKEISSKASNDFRYDNWIDRTFHSKDLDLMVVVPDILCRYDANQLGTSLFSTCNSQLGVVPREERAN